ncbi:hypothetical protein TNCV_960741 [Trichonephila clavipes]|nr:hypothetical protein TNCV_960741 [Trichonephila clavipes]
MQNFAPETFDRFSNPPPPQLTNRRERSDSHPPITETQAKSVPEPGEIGNLIEEVVDLARQINLEMDSNGVQELLDSHEKELTIDELIEMHEQDVEELESLYPQFNHKIE